MKKKAVIIFSILILLALLVFIILTTQKIQFGNTNSSKPAKAINGTTGVPAKAL